MMDSNLGSATVGLVAQEAEDDSAQLTMQRPAWQRVLAWFSQTWLIAFVLPFATLLWHNRYLFSGKLYPVWDFAADTVLTQKAKQFTLLVGNHSRVGFYHPGPANSYIRAGGEGLFYHVLHIVPAPWNAQVLTIFLLNCVLFATAVWIIDSWAHSRMVLIGVLAVAMGFIALHPYILDSPWMPNVYITPFLLLLISAASVSRGRTEHLWALVLSGGLLIHGHVCFFIFVPPIAGIAIAVPAWQNRDRLTAFLRREWRRRLAVPLVLAFLFALPMVLNLVLHWPGEFGKYISYSSSNKAGGHTVTEAVTYSLWYWEDGKGARYMLVGLFALAALLTRKHSDPQVRGFLFALLGADVVATIGMVYYAHSGVDSLTSTYIGEFTYMVPLTVLLVVTVNALDLIGRTSRLEQVSVATVGVLMILLAVRTHGSGDVLKFNDSTQPTALATLDRAAGGRTILFSYVDDGDWQPTIGMVDTAAWAGKRLCLIGAAFNGLIPTDYVCGANDFKTGVIFDVMPLAKYQSTHSKKPILAQLTNQVVLPH